MTQPQRQSDSRTASYRRLVIRTVVGALRNVFDSSYDRDYQLQSLKISTEYPKTQLDYPCVVVEYEGQSIKRAGVGHVEIFEDADGIVRKWFHNRFEGTLSFNIFALSTLDRDVMMDAMVEVLTFGTLYADSLLDFWTGIYGDPDNPDVELQFSQLMLNLDEVDEHGNSVSVAAWRPEDQMVYSTGLSIQCHGGFYNVVPDVTWEILSGVDVSPYPEGEQTVELPLANIPGDITNPRQFFDDNEMPDPQDPSQPNRLRGVAVISGEESLS